MDSPFTDERETTGPAWGGSHPTTASASRLAPPSCVGPWPVASSQRSAWSWQPRVRHVDFGHENRCLVVPSRLVLRGRRRARREERAPLFAAEHAGKHAHGSGSLVEDLASFRYAQHPRVNSVGEPHCSV